MSDADVLEGQPVGESSDGLRDAEEDPLGRRMVRREDRSIVSGVAKYTDDIRAADQAHAAIVRSRYGNALVESVETDEAEAVDGVVAVFTAADVDAGETPGNVPTRSTPLEAPPARLNEGLHAPRRPMMAEGRVRYAGEPVAVVVANDRYAAHEAAQLVDVRSERNEAVTDPLEAVSEDAPRVHDRIERNVALEWEIGDRQRTEDALSDADHMVELDLENQRLAPNALEPRSVLADVRGSGELVVTISTQVPKQHRAMLAETLGLPREAVSVRAPEVGGGFGLKSKFYPAEAIVAWCALQLERPIKWRATRSESFHSDIQGRGHVTNAVLGVDGTGRFQALKVETYVDVGAYVSKVIPWTATGGYGQVLSNQYRIPAIHCNTIGVFTNKAPLDAYRGAGKPEAAYVVERLVRAAADTLDIDSAEIRRRNFIPPEQFPYETPLGLVYDSGRYERAFDRALDLVGYDTFQDRQSELRNEGRYIGIGIGCLVEVAGDTNEESSVIHVDPSGHVTVDLASADHGQGHRTSFAQVVASRLGIPVDDVEVRQGDSERVETGSGTYGSRSAVVISRTLVECSGKIVDRGRAIAADVFGTGRNDVTFEDGRFHRADGTGEPLSLADVASAPDAEGPLDGERPGFSAAATTTAGPTVPFGTHVAVVEVEPDTGEISIERYVAVDDCGNQINPTIVEGQIHGGIAQGIGQALYEEVVYDENGTLLTDSYLNYCLPRAEHVPEIETESTVTPSPRNPLGVKGVGESGAVSSTVAVVNAVVDALEPFGVTDVGLPVSPEAVWKAMRTEEPETAG